MHEQRARVTRAMLFHAQRGPERRGDPWVTAQVGKLLVGDELGLHDEPCRAVNGLDLVTDGTDRALGERNDALRFDPDQAPGRRDPFHGAAQHAAAEVEQPLVRAQLAVSDVERLVVDEQPDHLAVGHVDHGLARLGEAVAALSVGQRP